MKGRGKEKPAKKELRSREWAAEESLMQKAILAAGAVALVSLATPASVLSAPCYGEAMRCAQDHSWKQQAEQKDSPARPRPSKHRRHNR